MTDRANEALCYCGRIIRHVFGSTWRDRDGREVCNHDAKGATVKHAPEGSER